MAGRKRASDETGPSTRASKAAKTDDSTTKAAKGGKRGPKATLAMSQFLSRASPLHLHITHTPPTLAEEETTPAAPADPGLIGSATLTASSFSTGSYGWKGTKRIIVELPGEEGGEEKEKVHVMVTINATVMGSKHAKNGEKETKEDETIEEEVIEEREKANGE